MLQVPAFVVWLALAVMVVAAATLVRRAFRDADDHRVRALVFGAVAIGLVVGVVMLRRHSYDVVVVEDAGAGKLQATRMLTIGEPDHDPKWIYARDPTWIINRSSRVVFLELVLYGSRPVTGPTRIEPGAVGVDRRIDHVGPDDPPPKDGTPDQPLLWLNWER